MTGADFLRYGGATSCVAISQDDDPPRLVLDAGTGLMRLSTLLQERPFVGSILISHLHWDHTHGLPFFSAGLRPGNRIRVLFPTDGSDPEELLSRAFSPPHFPVRPRELGGAWTFEAIEPGRHRIEGYDVTVEEIPHKGGRTLGYRVENDEAALAFLPDHAPLAIGPGPDGLGERHPAALRLADGVDLLMHDAQHRAAEFPSLVFLGHSSAEYAVALGNEADVAEVVLFHHAPTRTDDEIDLMVKELAGDRPVSAAAEGRHVDLPAAT
ncbi:MAG: MBL fold metallo-hydrolase [Pseudonocardiales bacterium]